MGQKAVQVQTRLILLLLLCLAACVRQQPIRLSPAIAYSLPERHVARSVQPSHAAPHPSCDGPTSRRLTRARKRELFRQFAAQDQTAAPDSQPDAAPLPAEARKPACRTAGR